MEGRGCSLFLVRGQPYRGKGIFVVPFVRHSGVNLKKKKSVGRGRLLFSHEPMNGPK
jgi:hypothetical protein